MRIFARVRGIKRHGELRKIYGPLYSRCRRDKLALEPAPETMTPEERFFARLWPNCWEYKMRKTPENAA